MRVLSRKWRRSRCRHRTTVSIHTLGFERLVCDSCGHVDVRMPDSGRPAESDVDRSVFARPSDMESGSSSGRHQPGD